MTRAERMAEITNTPSVVSWRTDIAYIIARVDALDAALRDAIINKRKEAIHG